MTKLCVVCEIACLNCNATYIRPTGKNLFQCIKEHKRELKEMDTLSISMSNTSARLATPSNGRIRPSLLTILSSGKDKPFESWHINDKRLSINREKSPLPSTYLTVRQPTHVSVQWYKISIVRICGTHATGVGMQNV